MLKIENLTKKYGSVTALNNVSFELGTGIYGLLGPNGAGKSTLMNIITLGLNADFGKITWNNESIYKLGGSYREILGFMPQQQGLYDGFSGFEFLNYIALLKGINKKEIRSEISRVSSLTNMTEHLSKKVSGYSGGMKQRLLLASAVIGNPKLVILDEPTAGLDPKERIRTRQLIQSISKDKTVIIATHIVSDIEKIADEIILMKSGKVIEKDGYKELCEKYGDDKGLEGVYMHFFSDEEVCDGTV